MSAPEFYQLGNRNTQPTGMSLPLPEDFAWSDKLPALVPLPNVLIGVRAAQRWVDIMTTNTSVYLYSEAVVQMVEKEGFQGMEFFPVEIGGVESPRLCAQLPWPRYYVGRVTGRIKAVVTTDEGELLPFDEVTGMYGPNDGLLKRGQLQPETWDGSDFLYVSTYPSYCFCTARVKEAVEKRKLHNFNFIAPYEPNVFTV